MGEGWEAGTRVRDLGGVEWLVVGPDPREGYESRVVVVGLGGLASFEAADLAPVPDTVRVEVEVPRGEAEAVREWADAFPHRYLGVASPTRVIDAHDRFRAALLAALDDCGPTDRSDP